MTIIRWTAEFLANNKRKRRWWNELFSILGEYNCQHKIIYLQVLQKNSEKNIFPDKQNWKCLLTIKYPERNKIKIKFSV